MKMNTINLDPRLTNSIKNLRTEALAFGDENMSNNCDRALDGDYLAIIKALESIGNALSQRDDIPENEQINIKNGHDGYPIVTDNCGARWFPGEKANEIIFASTTKWINHNSVTRAIVTIAPTMGKWHS